MNVLVTRPDPFIKIHIFLMQKPSCFPKIKWLNEQGQKDKQYSRHNTTEETKD
jgi:hypothetical protein